MDLRPYQLAWLDGIRAEFRAGRRRVLGVSPTGSGKTLVFTFMAHGAAARGRRVCILVHREELIDQTSRALETMGVDHGVIAASRTPAPALVQVASVFTLARRLTRYSDDQRYRFDFLVIDEAHHAAAGSWRTVLEAHPEAHVLGVTATPERHDGRGLAEFFEVMVLGPTVAELTPEYLSPAVVYAPADRLDLSGVGISMGDYDQKQLAARMGDMAITGDAIDHYRRLAAPAPAVAFCVTVAHAAQTAADFRGAGYRATHIEGAMARADQRQAIQDLGRGRLDVLTSCELISEGIDVPVIRCAILLRPTRSLAVYLQQVGRALRPYPGKSKTVILDHAGNVLRHGLPSDRREWSLEGKRRRAKKDSDAISVRQCEECYAVYPSTEEACPQCGCVPQAVRREIERREGELSEVRQTPRSLEEWIAGLSYRDVLGWAKTDDQVRLVARARGYKSGWAFHIIQMRRQRRGRAA